MNGLSFFTGVGGLDIGFQQAGIDVKLMCENNPACLKTLRANNPHTPIVEDIWEETADSILEASNLTSEDTIDVVFGGPPCQAFSTAGKRESFGDSRGNVFLHFVRIATALKPRYIVIENVRGLLSAKDLTRTPSTKALKTVLEMLSQAGYVTTFNLYNTANYGVPQSRERVILIAVRNQENPVPWITPTHQNPENAVLHPELQTWKTFRDATNNPNPIITHHHANFSPAKLEYYKLLKPGENWRSLPLDLQEKALGNSYHSGGGKTGFFRRLAWDKPSPTLLTHPAMSATALAHPEENRPLSIEEYKRIQQIPDSYIIEGSLSDQYRQVGNAVPTGFAEQVAKTVLKHSQGETENAGSDPSTYSYSRYKNTSHLDWEDTL